MPQSHILTVTQLTRQVKDILEAAFTDLWVEGEISNLSAPQSGHIYFTLKDAESQIRAVLFRSAQRHLKFMLEHGMQIICRGRVNVYEPRGEYQLIVEYIEPKGVGVLQKTYEDLKNRLQKEGLFETEHKKQLPLLPRRIGVVTSPTGAAIRDILRVIRRRHPRVEILIYPVPVQGPEAAPAIVEAIGYFNREKNVDVMIIGRGGGSLEDLWAFNEEIVARAVFSSKIPVISAVGHETDYTISDFVADLRAPTPSAAAEMVVEREDRLRETIVNLYTRLASGIRRLLDRRLLAVNHAARLLGDPRKILQQFSQRVDDLAVRLTAGFKNHVRRDRLRVGAIINALEHLNPLRILSRGYSLTKKLPEGSVLLDAASVRPGDCISTRLYRGEIVSKVVETSDNTCYPDSPTPAT